MKRKVDFTEGYVSDESSFYGDDDVREDYDILAGRALNRLYEPPVPRGTLQNADIIPKPNVLVQGKERAEREAFRTLDGKRTLDLVEVDHDRGSTAAWQRKEESIDAFLRRLPVADPDTAKVGPWLWVSSPMLPWAQVHREPANFTAFRLGGEAFDLLEAFSVQRAKIESQNIGKEPATITRKLAPYRDQLETDLLTLAVRDRVTFGKWMFFPAEEDLPRFWRLIATATAEGKLGPTSKVGTYDPAERHTLICVYTYDFSATEDVIRILDELCDLGLLAKNGLPIYYKCDAYTYLDIKSQNSYRLRASLYSSKELLHDKAKVLKDGSIGRLKKRNKKTHEFHDVFAGEDIP
ncbi:hypothetical protein M409DRAFT_48678 [Zasmidium cellare ATCC 36951]|uniref:DUF1917-domain-containing protein n=1 Tax=Zasmidium cellare ATCC 36951 TaxID=1080233 RepID=A0A6A6D3W7_ZASCE|nr:uncharacterized protein M409DRAFT_48678 [Zasmidium cellare ATCC 36951]KAF2173745.1 hypothetical protein M409DRAFT_48678 [Zasmidium cellare ATCC 36951]